MRERERESVRANERERERKRKRAGRLARDDDPYQCMRTRMTRISFRFLFMKLSTSIRRTRPTRLYADYSSKTLKRCILHTRVMLLYNYILVEVNSME